MTKLYHSADFQLDARQYNHPTRNEDYDKAFQDYCQLIANDPEAIGGTILGDLIDHKQRHDLLLKKIFDAMRPCFNQGKTLWFLGGNHDGTNPTLAEAIKYPGLKDAGEEFAKCLANGEPFQPYGADGPNVCALNFLTYNELISKLSEIKNVEIHKSTELWLHISMFPAVPQIQSPLNQTMIHHLGWDTIVAGDTHNPGAFECSDTNGKLLIPGSPEMTDINEKTNKGFLINDINKGWDKIPYSPRPFKTFDFGDTEPQESQIREVIKYLDDLKDEREPIIKIISAGGWRKNKDIRPRTLIILEDKPKKRNEKLLESETDVNTNNDSNPKLNIETKNTWNALCQVAKASKYSKDSKSTILNVINNPKDPESWGNEPANN